MTESADALICERITRDHARTFALASRLLPPTKRRGAFALYAFCRIADDVVDVTPRIALGSAADALDAYERRLVDALAGRPADPVFRELAWAVRTFALPSGLLHELIRAVGSDLAPARFAAWPDLARYCEGVASTVGELCAHIFGVTGGPATAQRALRYARTLGVAMQLTNVLRDIGEDARRGRCYLPDEDLAMFGLTRDDVLTNPLLAADERWRPLMAFEVGRARSLYEAARPGIALLDADAQACARACSTGYAAILGAIEQMGYDTISSRARLALWARASILWSAWRGTPGDCARVGNGPCIAWDRWSPERPSWT